MRKLLLMFDDSVLKEVPIGESEIRIGRSPDSSIVIDNPAVSHYHARVFQDGGRLTIEDLGSLNGTFVNGQRARTVGLKVGDAILIGKHTILVDGPREVVPALADVAGVKKAPPKINETVMLDTKARREFLQQVAAAGESTQVSPDRLRVATVVVHHGKTDQREYVLTDRLTVIGKSPMATIKLTGWFSPKAAAQINRRNQDYYIGAADRVPRINGNRIVRPTKLSSGDIIEVSGIRLEFLYRD
jgi:pSer/pThr/pTyr-binding forkhead associated (FHA) protein